MGQAGEFEPSNFTILVLTSPQNGRVSPRKSGQSDKSSTSPIGTGVNQKSGGKDNSTERKRTSSSAPPAAALQEEASKPLTQLGQTQIKNEQRDNRELATMPPVIEEGQEPPHADVLPT